MNEIQEAQYEVVQDANTPTSIRIRTMSARDVLAKKTAAPQVSLDGSLPLYRPYNQLLSRNPTTLKYANEGYSRNSIIFTITTKRASSLASIPLIVRNKKTKELLPDSDYQKLMDAPNPYMSRSSFIRQMSLYVDVGGTCFANKVRDSFGVVSALFPYHASQINYVQGMSEWIQCYRYDNGVGYTKMIDKEDICEFRFPSTSFVYPYKTESPLLALLKEVDVDNQRGELEVALLLNGGAPAFAIYPGESIQVMTQDQMNTIMEGIITKINGRNRGRPLLMNKDFEIQAVGYKPSDMMLTLFTEIPETRACSVYGGSPGFYGFLAGLKYAGTYANREVDKRSFWEDVIVPTAKDYAEAINRSFGGDRYNPPEMFHDGISAADCVVEFDISNLPQLMEASDALQGRIIEQWESDLIIKNRALQLLGEEEAKDESGTKYYSETISKPAPIQPSINATIPTPEDKLQPA